MARLPEVVALCAVFAGLPAASAPRLRDTSFPFPAHVGTHWVYDDGECQDTQTVTAVHRDRDRTVVTLAVRDGGLERDVIEVTPGGWFWVEHGDWPMGVCLIRLPPRSGERWGFRGCVGAQRARQHTWTVGEWEWVEVPAGRFRAVRVDWDRQRDAEEEWRVTRWYAPGVGMVKERNAGHLRVLVAFTQARQ